MVDYLVDWGAFLDSMQGIDCKIIAGIVDVIEPITQLGRSGKNSFVCAALDVALVKSSPCREGSFPCIQITVAAL